jgi:hypothetical protein
MDTRREQMGLDEFMRDRLAEREGAQEQPPAQPEAGRPSVITPDQEKFWHKQADHLCSLKLAERDAQWKTAVLDAYLHRGNNPPASEFIADIASRLAQTDKPRTPAERVTVDCDAVDQWYVTLDGAVRPAKFTNKRDAGYYAAGLRAELEKAQ